MSTYNPPSFPRRSKTSTPINELYYQARLLHYRYEINTGLYVMSPGEKLAFNLIFLALATLLLSTVYYCTPPFVTQSLHRLAGFLCSGVKGSVYRVDVSTAVLQGGVSEEHVSSLLPDHMGTNATMMSVPGF
ncbi:hypothetical protein MBLNU13_g04452t1 [Cladosporium sp. NU13]